MKIPHTHYLLQIKITEYIFEVHSSTISESSCPSENVTNPHTVPINVFCAEYGPKNFPSMLLPSYTFVTTLYNQILTFLYSTFSGSFVWAYKTFFKQLLAVLQWISHGRFSPREPEFPRRRGQKCSWLVQGIDASEALHLVFPSLAPLVSCPFPLSFMTVTSRLKFCF